MKKIRLTRGKFAKVDDVDFDWLNQRKWYYAGGYAICPSVVLGKQRTVRMHREIMKTPDGMETDHIDGDGLNNRRSNLRVCTKSENQRNRGKDIDNTSGYKGVVWRKRDHKWRAQIKVNGRFIDLGSFDTLEEAAQIYDEAAIEYHGEFAYLNFGGKCKG